MDIRVGILVGVAASALFYLIQKYFLEWRSPWDIVSTALVLLGATGLAVFFARREASNGRHGTSVMSGIHTKQGMTAKIDGLETKEPPDKVLSDIKVEGDAAFEIKNTKL